MERVIEQAPVKQRRNPLRLVVKALLYLIVKPAVLIVMAFRRFTFWALIASMVIIGGLYYAANGLTLVSSPAAGGDGGRISAELYLTGQSQYQARLMWDSYGDEGKQNLARRGETLETLSRKLEQDKQRGIKYTDFKFVASAPLEDGRMVHLYIVSATVQTAEGSVRGQVPYTFTVDKSGKIANVD